MDYTIEQLQKLRESEDKVEFKAARNNFSFDGGSQPDQSKRRKCFLGYIVALCNEKGGTLVLGMSDNNPHDVVGSNFYDGRIGDLEDKIYSVLQIRVRVKELFDENRLRVLVTYVPSRPIGRIMKFEGVGLMRTGESLRVMSDDEARAILNEQESDFSEKICKGLTISDLDQKAVATLKEKYSLKADNETFLIQSDEQALIDLDLLVNGQLTYAALILLGKTEKIKEYLPQCAINLEYRENPNNIAFDQRTTFLKPYFLLIDELWKIINVRNKNTHIQVGSYIVDFPELNDEVIRESINNAVAHRDYAKTSEIVIKQSSAEFTVHSHGGFPLGVSAENILTINSTPRNRLLADVLTKTGLVERSGQGVDKIFYQNLSDGKDFPSYSDSDLFQVTLRIPITVEHPMFAFFTRQLRRTLLDEQKLGVHDIIALAKIREKYDISGVKPLIIQKLLEIGAIKKDKETYLLSDAYSEIIRTVEGSDQDRIIDFISDFHSAKMGDIISLFDNRLTRRQVNNLVFNLVKKKILLQEGKGFGTTYRLNLQDSK
ncbi:MAG: ATP-binding protein [Acidobacteriota bacterium]